MELGIDWIANGQGIGDVATVLLENDFNAHMLRRWKGRDRRNYAMVYNTKTRKYEPTVVNAPASLLRDEWIQIDRSVIEASQAPLRAVADLVGRGLTYTIPNGMGKTILEYQTLGDITPATTSMDGMRQSEEDTFEVDIAGLPLPIIHKDFSYSARRIATARASALPLDTTTARLAARRVSQEVEDYLLGVKTFAYGGYNVYGYTNLPSRKTKTLSDPAGVGWTPNTLITEVLDMIQLAVDDNQYGPFMLYLSPSWGQYLENDYSAANPNSTLRQRLAAIDEIISVRTIPRLPGLQILLVQMTEDVIREVIGMPMTTLQWETLGGMRLHFKVMAIMVPQARPDQAGNAAIVHGSVP